MRNNRIFLQRKRSVYSIIIICVTLVALGSRYFSVILPKWFSEYAGDTLWALTVFLVLGFLFNTLLPFRVAFIAFIFSVLIEISQLFHAPWIDSIRSSHIGGLVLGYEFLWSDFVCYGVGITIGLLAELLLISKK